MKCQKMGGILEPTNPLGNSVWVLGAPFARGQWSSLSGSHLPAFLKCYALCSFTSPAQPLWHVIQLHLLSLRLYLWEETDWSYVSHVCFAGNISDIFLRTERKRLLEWTGEGEGTRTKGKGDTWCQKRLSPSRICLELFLRGAAFLPGRLDVTSHRWAPRHSAPDAATAPTPRYFLFFTLVIILKYYYTSDNALHL